MWFHHTVEQLAEQLWACTVRPTDLLECYLARIDRLNPRMNAYVALNDSARAEAAASDARWAAGRPLSRLDGIPVAIKDNLWARGMPATWGSRLFERHVPSSDEAPVAALRRAGIVVLGKTNTPEFAFGGFTRNELFGETRNPWNTALTPGGSSGGSVAAVAAGLAPFALGTDAGGSTRRPAAYTGLVGYKPSLGRIPRAGGFPSLFYDLEAVGLITRRVGDISLVAPLLAGSSLLEEEPQPPVENDTEGGVQQAAALRVRVVRHIRNSAVERRLAEGVSSAGEHLRALGHSVDQGELDIDAEEVASWTAVHMGIELRRLSRIHPDFFRLVQPRFADMVLNDGQQAVRRRKAEVRIRAFRESMATLFKDTDILLTPTVACQPWPIGVEYPTMIADTPVGPYAHAVFTRWVNVAGLPAISIPFGLDEKGVPMGVQLIAAPDQDDQLIEVAADLEGRLADLGQWPPLKPKAL
jgi:aspartyl-tRNA(Asn)/glutamyl-tRNA(Gln) amidotransferase subunit A